MKFISTLAAFLLLLLPACAELTIPDDGPRNRPDVQEEPDTRDSVDTPDVTEDTDDGDTEDVDPTDFCPEEPEVCEAGSSRCNAAGDGVEVCNTVCLAYLPDSATPCANDELCYELEEGATCQEPQFSECDPFATNSGVCLDSTRFAPCNRDGSLGSATTCSTGTRCADGQCRTDSAATGAACNNSGDCADTCICGTDFSERISGECDDTPMVAGYCSVNNCTQDGCKADEICALLSQTGFAGSSDVCLASSPCDGLEAGDPCTIGSRGGFVCRNVPTEPTPPNAIAWGLACYDAKPRAIGDECTNSNQCIGDSCLRDPNASVCTQICNGPSECPSGTRCVFDPDRIDVNDPETLEAQTEGYCLLPQAACDGTDDPNDTMVVRRTRTFGDSEQLISICFFAEE